MLIRQRSEISDLIWIVWLVHLTRIIFLRIFSGSVALSRRRRGTWTVSWSKGSTRTAPSRGQSTWLPMCCRWWGRLWNGYPTPSPGCTWWVSARPLDWLFSHCVTVLTSSRERIPWHGETKYIAVLYGPWGIQKYAYFSNDPGDT